MYEKPGRRKSSEGVEPGDRCGYSGRDSAITVSQIIALRIAKRSPSTTPVKAVSKVLNVKSTRKDRKEMVSQEIHWTYGTSWGFPEG